MVNNSCRMKENVLLLDRSLNRKIREHWTNEKEYGKRIHDCLNFYLHVLSSIPAFITEMILCWMLVNQSSLTWWMILRAVIPQAMKVMISLYVKSEIKEEISIDCIRHI